MKNYHYIQIRYVPPSASKPESVKLRSLLFIEGKTVVLPLDKKDRANWTDLAVTWLKENEFELDGIGYSGMGYIIASTTEKPL